MSLGVTPAVFSTFKKTFLKFMIIMAMAAIGFQTNLKQLITKGGSNLVGEFVGLLISLASLLMQKLLGLW